MLLNILLVILVIDCVALTGVILLQRSEGGALGMGGGPTSMFSARGAGDLLSRTTAVLATVFFVLSLGITLLAGHSKATSSVTERMKVNPIDLNALSKQQAPPASSAPAQTAPPLPGADQLAAPPLPGAVQQAQPTQAPRPAAHVARRTAPPPAPLPTVAPGPVAIPRPNLNAPAAPASGQPGTTP
jgi:preprotein translocase subunit SecG